MAEAASRFKGKQVEVEILTDTYKIRGAVFVSLAGKHGYSARLPNFLNNPKKKFSVANQRGRGRCPPHEMKWEAPFQAVNNSVVTIVHALKE
jgi:hypothetical protein